MIFFYLSDGFQKVDVVVVKIEKRAIFGLEEQSDEVLDFALEIADLLFDFELHFFHDFAEVLPDTFFRLPDHLVDLLPD